MKITKEKAKENLAKLIEKFKAELNAGQIPTYNEEATKHAFIQPLLHDVLGWDIHNRDEVAPEERLSHGRVDYGLKIDGKTKILVETKQPNVDLQAHGPIKQAIRYGYSRKDVNFVLLTDFEEFELFDLSIKPTQRNIKKGRKINLTWNKYIENFDMLWLISRESVANGDLDKKLLAKPKDRHYVDDDILEDLKKWREILSKDIYKNNPKLFHSNDIEKDSSYLKEITQKILDRIIFMRSCEDRGLMHRKFLKDVFEERAKDIGPVAMEFLKAEFNEYNRVFDSDLFRPQEWEDALAIDYNVMRQIIEESYDPYDFGVISIEVLGYIYEQYLGYTLNLTEQQVKYELKSDVRKAGGVYYTPEYIVDYIVKNTVGKLLNELPPAKIKKMRILDPACGSGSFLIRAYKEMLNWYSSQKQGKQKIADEHPSFDLDYEKDKRRLTLYEKREILKNHIFGVDIDEEAVEVTKLSLMLKMLEGEFAVLPSGSLLPMLDHNIQCGNSLISDDTLELKKYFGDGLYKIKPFRWEERFKDIVSKSAGFDIVIGNPPWGGFLSEEEKKYLWDHYVNRQGEAESHLFFIEKGFNLLNKTGMLGYITPNTWLSVLNSKEIREYIIKKTNIYEICELSDRIFKDAPAIVPIMIFIGKKKNNIKICRIKRPCVDKVDNENFGKAFVEDSISQDIWLKQKGTPINLRLTSKVLQILEKCKAASISLENICDVIYGIKTGNNKKYLSEKKSSTHTVKALKTGDLTRYNINWQGVYLWWSKDLAGYRASSLEIPKIVVQYIRNLRLDRRIIAAYDEKGIYYPLNNYSYIMTKDAHYSLKYILGIINSSLLNFYFKNTFIDYNIKPTYLQQLPIFKINFSNLSEKKHYDNIVQLVNDLIDLKERIRMNKGSEKDQIQHMTENTDKEIDELIYKLYGINENEKMIIENEESK